MKIYADNAATTKMCPAAIEAMLPFLDRIYGNPSSLHSVGQEAAEALADARQRIAACIGADPGEIVFTSGGSEADNQAILSAARLGRQQGRQHIISTAFEHHAVLHTLEKLKREGFEVTLLDVHENGIVLPHQVEEAIRENTCLVTVMYANNEIGTIQPIREIGAICRAKGVPFHTDAVQAAGHLPIHVGEQNLDLLSLSAHKFHGPKGVGVLYARKGIPLFPLIEGGAQERGRRAGTENLPAIMGMTAALELACSQIDENARHLTALRDQNFFVVHLLAPDASWYLAYRALILIVMFMPVSILLMLKCQYWTASAQGPLWAYLGMAAAAGVLISLLPTRELVTVSTLVYYLSVPYLAYLVFGVARVYLRRKKLEPADVLVYRGWKDP